MDNNTKDGLDEGQRALCLEVERRITLHYTQAIEDVFSSVLDIRNEGEIGKRAFERAKDSLRNSYSRLDELGVKYKKRFDLDKLV